MKKVIGIAVASGLAAMAVSAGTSVSVDIASAYVFRGATVVDDLVVQPGVEIDGFGMPEEYGAIAIGAWGSTAPFSDTYDNLHETDWYVSYALPELATNLNLYVGFTEYMYTVPLGEQEISISADYTLGEFVLGGSANFMIDDDNPFTEKQKYFDFYADYGVELSEEADLTVGALVSFMLQGKGNAGAIGGNLDDGFNHAEIYGAFSYAINEMWSFGASLAYIEQLDSDVLSNAAHDKGLVGMLSLGCSM